MSPYESSKNPFDTSEGGLAVEEYIDEIDEKNKDFFPEAIPKAILTDDSEEKEEIVDMKKEHDALLRLHEQKLSDLDRIQYEENQSAGFHHVIKLDNEINTLKESLPLLKARKDYSKEDLDVYQTEKHDLETKVEMRDRVNQFETMLWGNSPQEYVIGRQNLLNDIASIENTDDISSFFEKWGALPGASTVSAPASNEIAVSYFIKHIDEYSDDDAYAHAEKLIPHKRLREKILAFRSPHVESEVDSEQIAEKIAPDEAGFSEIVYENTDPLSKIREASPDVWDEKRDIPSPRQRIPEEVDPLAAIREASPDVWDEKRDIPSLRQKSASAEQTPHTGIETPSISAVESQARWMRTVEDEEMQLKEQEDALIQAKEVISSKLFEYAPFLMRFTKKGREGIAILKKAGLDIGTRGSTVATVEMARAFKLKSLRERESVKNPETPRFAHDLDARKQSVTKAKELDMQIPITSAWGERAQDIEELSQKITKRKHAKNIKKVLAPDAEATSNNVKRNTEIENSDDEMDSLRVEDIVSSLADLKRKEEIVQAKKEAAETQRIKDYNDNLSNTAKFEIPTLTEVEKEKVQKMRAQIEPILDVVRGSSEEFDDMGTTAEMSIADLSPENRSTVETARERKLPKKQREIKTQNRKALTRFKNKKATRKATTQKMREVTGNVNLTDEQARVEVRAGSRRKKANK